MYVRYPLVILPVHRRTFEAYYLAHDQFVAKQKARLEKQWGKAFDRIGTRDWQLRWEALWFPPFWYFNDLIGFLQIGTDTWGGRLGGDVFLRRKHFPFESAERSGYRHHSTLKRQEILHYCEVPARKVEPSDNESYVRAAREIIAEARDIVRKRARKAELWLPPFDLGCLDMAEADRQGRQ